MQQQRASTVLASAIALSIVSAMALSGCAAPKLASVAPVAGVAAAKPANTAPWIAVPPTNVGAWYDLGAYQAPWLAGDGPVPVAGPNAPTRVVGWLREADPANDALQTSKGSADDWLAIVIVQVAPGATAPCSTQATSLDVEAAGPGCLRLRRDADFDRWLQAAEPTLYRWVDAHGWTSEPRAWAAYRLPSAGSGAVEVHALIDPSLIEPTIRNTTDFITSGGPGQQWARQLAAAVRATNGAAGSTLTVPPFPFAPAPRATPEATLPDELPTRPEGNASAPADAAASAPAVAEQVTPQAGRSAASP
ncbi:MAG: hypothetical protein LBH31_08345 [Burkholderiaceae bacterium]|jgi:hypothetical protein|nr:hypothetical protein [Burkholderiaceae bacterium]